MQVLWKKNERKERDARKVCGPLRGPIGVSRRVPPTLTCTHTPLRGQLAEKQRAEEQRRREEEREQQRQQRKFNFLLTQTELYAHFMQKKISGTGRVGHVALVL